MIKNKLNLNAREYCLFKFEISEESQGDICEICLISLKKVKKIKKYIKNNPEEEFEFSVGCREGSTVNYQDITCTIETDEKMIKAFKKIRHFVGTRSSQLRSFSDEVFGREFLTTEDFYHSDDE